MYPGGYIKQKYFERDFKVTCLESEFGCNTSMKGYIEDVAEIKVETSKPLVAEVRRWTFVQHIRLTLCTKNRTNQTRKTFEPQ